MRTPLAAALALLLLDAAPALAADAAAPRTDERTSERKGASKDAPNPKKGDRPPADERRGAPAPRPDDRDARAGGESPKDEKPCVPVKPCAIE